MNAYGKYLLAATLACFTALPLLADAGDPPDSVARLAYLEGTVSIQPSGVNNWSQADTNYPIATGDRIYSDNNGRAELSIGQTIARLGHDTDLTMTNLNNQIEQFGLAQGILRLRTFAMNPGTQVEVDTPNGAILVTRPGDIRVESYQGDGGTVVEVNSGEVQVTGPNMSQNIGAGEAVRLAGTNPIAMSAIAMPGLDRFDRWSIDRDRMYEDSQSARYVSRDMVGYSDLDQYGNWEPQTEYGPVWYPSAVPVGWAPYRYGHWVWVAPWGWTWVSDEPWGYAPFHYGRWAYIGSRWGWVPGPVYLRPIWSPALVVFLGGGGFSFGLTSWFPLGVGEPYIPWYNCSPYYRRQVNITNINIVNIHNTTIINNYNTFVRNTNNYTNIRNVNYQYSNRERAFTAVNRSVFMSAQPVDRHRVAISAERMNQARIIRAPGVRPTSLSVVPRPVRVQQVSPTRPTLLTQGGRMAQAVPHARPEPVPYRALPVNAARAPLPQHGIRPQQGVVPQNRAAIPENRTATPVAVRPNLPARSSAPGERGFARPLITRQGTSYPDGRPGPEPRQSQSGNRPVVSRTPTVGRPQEERPLIRRNEPSAESAGGRLPTAARRSNDWPGRTASPAPRAERPAAPRMPDERPQSWQRQEAPRQSSSPRPQAWSRPEPRMSAPVERPASEPRYQAPRMNAPAPRYEAPRAPAWHPAPPRDSGPAGGGHGRR